jgi:hypothetical protein
MRAPALPAALLLLLCALPALAVEPAIPYYPDHPVTSEELKGKTLRELDLMRNTIYARAGNVFRKAWLHDYFAQQSWYKPTGLDESRLSELDKQNAVTIGNYAASIPRQELQDRLDALYQKQSLSEEEQVERTLLARALGRRSLGEKLETDSSPLDNPALLDRPLTTQQLKDMSARDLRLLRNMIYARRGRPFKGKDMREYFSRMEWYKPDPKYTEARLTRIDHRNIKVVQSVEQEIDAATVETLDRRGVFGGA